MTPAVVLGPSICSFGKRLNDCDLHFFAALTRRTFCNIRARMGAAHEGIWRAVLDYDLENQTVRLSTYAAPKIRRALQNEAVNYGYERDRRNGMDVYRPNTFVIEYTP